MALRFVVAIALFGLLLIAGGCTPSRTSDASTSSSTAATAEPTIWEPPESAASGLTIADLPDTFTYVETQLTIGFVGHIFESNDGSRFAVGRTISPGPLPFPGETVVLDGRTFTFVVIPEEIRTLENVGDGVRVEVVGYSLESDVLFRIAKSVRYDPDRDTQRDSR